MLHITSKRSKMSAALSVFLLISILFSCDLCAETDTLSTNQTLVPGQTLVSKGGKFELGFFSRGNSTDLYLGIWYNIPSKTVVWVANRDTPIRASYNSSSELKISDGYLKLNINAIWVRISNASNVTEAVILESGNFVLGNGWEIVWQSFDYPTDTWLPGASIGFGLSSAVEAKIVSWKSPYDPSTGSYSLGMSPNQSSELFITNSSSTWLWRSGILQGVTFLNNTAASFNFTYGTRDDNGYLTFNVLNESTVSRIVISFEGQMFYSVWEGDQWYVVWIQPQAACSTYAMCGANAICGITETPPCTCLNGFSPKDEQAWNMSDFSGGCVRKNPLYCNDGYDGYLKVSDIKLPANPQAKEVTNNRVCQFACSDDCSCQAYAYNSRGTCLLFMADIVDMESLPNAYGGGDLFVRLNDMALSDPPNRGRRHLLLPLVIILPTVALAIMVCLFRVCYLWRKFRNKASSRAYQDLLLLDLNSHEPVNGKATSQIEHERNSYELPIFSFSSIVMATSNFAVENMLGEGGFGPVYKGQLLNGQLVAIKRLSRRSGQGLEEFKTEIELIAKLQHRNLVGILGCCSENDEKILIYEYMENKSLDFFLFDSSRKASLDWTRRVQIIEGVAQGLLYLHHYSRLRIVHRDLKASNILLDDEMNPKISDFGMARIFGGKDSQANTERIVGTFGYMSPEYTMHGLFSVKSDVYAFGVLMLEIISGTKNTGFYGSEHLSLLGYAWNLWENDRVLELIDPTLRDSSSDSIPARCIQIGLLCVQENASDSPLMSDVVAMLSNEQKELAMPKHPAFTVGRLTSDGEEKYRICSVNELTISSMEPR